MLRRLLRTGFDSDTAEQHDSTSDVSSSSRITARGCLLLPLVLVGGTSASDNTEQADSMSDTLHSWVEPTGVEGSGLWSLDTLVHLFLVEVGGHSGVPPSLFSLWLQASTEPSRVGLSACLAALLVLRAVEGVACENELRHSLLFNNKVLVVQLF